MASWEALEIPQTHIHTAHIVLLRTSDFEEMIDKYSTLHNEMRALWHGGQVEDLTTGVKGWKSAYILLATLLTRNVIDEPKVKEAEAAKARGDAPEAWIDWCLEQLQVCHTKKLCAPDQCRISPAAQSLRTVLGSWQTSFGSNRQLITAAKLCSKRVDQKAT